MTKTKKRKMSKSTFAIIIMAVVMVAMLAFGGSYAYFTATATSKTGTVDTGVITLSTDGATFTITKTNVLPKESILSTEDAQGISYSAAQATRAQVAFFTFTVEIEKDDAPVSGATLTMTLPTSGLFADAVTLEGGSATTSTVAILVPASTASITMGGLQVAFDATAESVNGSIPDLMGATITLTIEAKSIQAVGSDGTEITELNEENAAAMYELLSA